MNTRSLRDVPRLIRVATQLLFALLVFAFFGYGYPHHLHYQEQFQLFECTAGYALHALSQPGGLADYLSAFLTQFYVNSRFGGCFIALLLVGIQILTARRMHAQGFIAHVLSYFPAWVMLYFLLDEHALLSAPIALLGSLAVANALCHLSLSTLRRVLTLVGIPLTYWWFGGLCVVFVVAMTLEEVRRGWNAASTATLAAAVVLLAACPIVGQYLWPYPLDRLARGLHYYRYPAVFPTWVWASAGVEVAVMILALALKRPAASPQGKGWLGSALQAVCILATSAFIPHHYANWGKEDVMAYNFFARYQLWGKILEKANEETPLWTINICYLNLALGMTGNLPDYQFHYFQYSEDGLFPEFERDFTSPLATSEVFYYLGFINTAQRYTFEAQEAIPDGQKSVRCYQRLAETALINGEYDISRKYLRPLLHTIFYKDWAQKVWALTEDEKAFNARPLYKRLRFYRTPEDYLFSDTEIDSMLGRLFLTQKDCRMTFEYLMSYELLHRNLDLFYKYCSLGKDLGYKKLPKSYQEALLLRWALTHTDFNGFPWQVDKAIQQRMVRFIQDYRANRPMSYLREAYAGTYWLFYIQETIQYAAD